MNRSMHLHPLLTLVLVFAMLFSPLTTVVQAQEGNPVWLPLIGSDVSANQLAATDVLFRTQITVTSPTQWTRLTELGVTVLKQMESSAVVLADYEQMTALARLRFHPRNSEELGALVNAGAQDKPWIATALRPLAAQAALVSAEIGSPLAAFGADETVQVRSAAALSTLRSTAQALTLETRAAVVSLPTVDDDGDGLTNTEEAWWCTDPNNANSDGDAQGYTDGQEVAALLDVTQPRNLRWGYGPPFGPPNPWPNFNNRNATGVNVCNDGDFDTIPDYAEAYMVGTRTGVLDAESTDNDKFDDGQELFGLTYCPGGDLSCDYGSYPRIEYWSFIKSSMPSWVLPPGDSPFVAAFPVLEVYVEPGSWTVERVTTITTTEGEIVEQTNSYETAVTRGQSTSIANTVTWNEWEEVSESVERPLGRNTDALLMIQDQCQPVGSLKCRTFGVGKITGGHLVSDAAGLIGGCGLGFMVAGPAGCLVGGAIGYVAGAVVDEWGNQISSEGWDDLTGKKDEVQSQIGSASYSSASATSSSYSSANASITLNQNFDFQGVVDSLDGVQYAINQQGALLSRGLQDVAYAISQPRLTETRTSGKSWGGAQTTTHEVYEEHTISQGEAFTTGQNWSTAWAVDSSHAADLTFNYTVQNAGTEYARELSNLIFNIYLGDDKLPTVTYAAWEQFAGGRLDNLFPVGPNTPPGVGGSKTFASNRIPLSLEQMKRIDLGERLTVKVESYSYGADELFYTDAVNGGVTVFIEDGIEDGDESVDMYVIPTWGVESVEDVLTRYFPAAYDAEGNINSLWTPEFSGVDAPTWHEHYLSDIAWWNVYLTQSDAGDTALKDLPARAGAGMLFRFNRDSDRDGYNDRAEFRYYCALPQSHADRVHCDDAHLRADIHPQPELLAGYVLERNGDVVTAKLALENTGNFDAYGIDAVMYSPDATTTIGNNTVGGNGRVRPGSSVVVGSLIKQPSLNNWGSSTSKPYATGQFTGTADLIFTFSAETPGVVGTGSTAVRWNDGVGNSAVLDLGSSYHAPLPLDVAHGVQVGFNTGTVAAGASFTMTALTPRDTFTFTVNSEPFTPPVLVVSYSHPQGSTRFVTPVELTQLGEGLSTYSGQMLEGLALQIVSEDVLKADSTNTTHLVVNSPHPSTIKDAHLHLNFVSDGKLVLEQSHILDFPPGPTTFSAQWAVANFSADYNPNGDNLLIAFWTDSENNIIDSTARPLPTFAVDPRPAADSDAANWGFGTVTQGEVLKRTVSLASVGDLGLLGYVGDAPGLSVSQFGSKPVNLGDLTTYELTLDTRVLPVGNYDETITLRTNDPQNPRYTLQVTGVIAPLIGDAYARPVVDRPLDVEVWVSGPHDRGDWIEFEHDLAPLPDEIHPVRVYTNDGELLGMGEYALDFVDGSAWLGSYGTGADEDIQISTPMTFDPSRTSLAQTVQMGEGIIHLTNAAGFDIGEEILLFQVQGSDAGTYEFARIAAKLDNQLTLYRTLNNTFTQGGASKVQVVQVPHYRNVTITSTGGWYAPGWNGIDGGIIVFRVSGNLTIESGGFISASGRGFRGTSHGPVYRNQTGVQGEGYTGSGTQTWGVNGNGGGGGQGTQDGGGGGGGGHTTAGTNGIMGQPNSRIGGTGGQAVGSPDLQKWFFGGAGGEGGADEDGGNPGAGGYGGGAIAVFARVSTFNGGLYADGTAGGNGCSTCGGGAPSGMAGGGGGAGGSIFLNGYDIASNSGIVQVNGGGGGYGYDRGGHGGSGSVGRVHIETCNAPTGNIPAFVHRSEVSCAIAFQTIDDTTFNTRLVLPDHFAVGYALRVQYARKLDFAGPGGLTTLLRVPAGEWTSATLDALVSGVGTGELTAKIDVGNNGTWDWTDTQTVTNTFAFTNVQLVDAFLPYVTGTGDREVEVKVYLSKPGQLLLTDMVIERNESVDVTPSFTLSGTPTEGATVPINVTLNNNGAADSGPLTVAFYATRNSPSAAPFYIGSSFIANIPAGGSVPAPFNWNTLGFTGPVTVTAGVDPYNRLTETDENNNNKTAHFTILTRPDLTLTQVVLSSPEPLAGETVTVTAKLANDGETAAPAHAFALYQDNPEGGTLIQSQSVSSLGASAQRTITFAWTPTTPGLHRLFLRSDRANQVNESDESNNDHWLDVYVGIASPVQLDSGAPGEVAYSVGSGYGVVDTDQDDNVGSCGTETYQTFRRDPDSAVVYRFDHLQPGRFYHLDIVMYNCPGEPQRLQTVSVDGVLLTATPEDLGDGQPHVLSLLVDPALYADRSLVVSVVSEGINGTVVNAVNLHDIDYRYADAGGANDPRYPGSRGFGWLDDTSTANTAWGRLPAQSVRVDQNDQELHYQFDGLKPEKRYNVHLSFRQGSGSTATTLKVQVDGIDSVSSFSLATNALELKKIPVLPMHYAADGSIVVKIVRPDLKGPFVNEIALEEETIAPLGSCVVQPTPSGMDVYGAVTINGAPAPAGTIIQAINPDGVTVGCVTVETAGVFPSLRIYGEDPAATSPIPGMRNGQRVTFRVAGALATSTPSVYWQDGALLQTELKAAPSTAQLHNLAPAWNQISFFVESPALLVNQIFQSIGYDLVLAENGSYIPSLDPAFNLLKEIHCGQSYYVRTTASTTSQMLTEGLRCPVETPLSLHKGWNWIGYLPHASLPVAEALASIEGQYQRVIDLTKIYMPANLPASTLKTMDPGKGYLIYMDQAAVLTYPLSVAAAQDDPVSVQPTLCSGVQPTPYATLLYGTVHMNGTPAPVGTRIEMVTPAGDVVGCVETSEPGFYPAIFAYGRDHSSQPIIPGFVEGDVIRVRVNGLDVNTAPIQWASGFDLHQLDLNLTAENTLYLPHMSR